MLLPLQGEGIRYAPALSRGGYSLCSCPFKGRAILMLLPLQGGGQEGDGDLSDQYKYVFSIMDSLVTTFFSHIVRRTSEKIGGVGRTGISRFYGGEI